jgi:hypothetical protein
MNIEVRYPRVWEKNQPSRRLEPCGPPGSKRAADFWKAVKQEGEAPFAPPDGIIGEGE